VSQAPDLRLIPLNSIRPSPYQYRTNFDDAKQQEMMESLKETGLSTPILVRPIRTPSAESGQTQTEIAYELVSGERRWRAGKALGWETIRAICEEMTDAEASARVVTENEVRSDTNIMEKAAGYKRLTQPPCSMTVDEIAKRYGYRNHASVSLIIGLLDQPSEIRDLVSRETIGEKHVRFLSRIKDLNARVKLAKRAADEEWSTKETEARVAKVLGKAHKKLPKSTAKHAAAYEYDYNGFHCKLIGDEVELSGRRFKRGKEMLRQYVTDLQVALESFVRDIDAKSAEKPATDGPDRAAGLASTEVAPSAEISSSEVTADLAKQLEAAAQPINELFTRITSAKKEGGTPGLADLLSIFEKPKSSG
jgi:ParB family transcriptional regulator, chromosome partitioning protein